MGFLKGYVCVQLDAAGNSAVTRFTHMQDAAGQYGIDSPAVEDVQVFADGEELDPLVERGGPTTLVDFDVDTPAWVGMNYTRADFAAQTDGHWRYWDNWDLPDPVLFVLLLPEHAVIESATAESKQAQRFLDERYRVDSQLVLGARVMDRRFDLDIEYAIDETRFHQQDDFPALEAASVANIGDFRFQNRAIESADSAIETQRLLLGAREGLDMVGRGITVATVLDVFGAAPPMF